MLVLVSFTEIYAAFVSFRAIMALNSNKGLIAHIALYFPPDCAMHLIQISEQPREWAFLLVYYLHSFTFIRPTPTGVIFRSSGLILTSKRSLWVDLRCGDWNLAYPLWRVKWQWRIFPEVSKRKQPPMVYWRACDDAHAPPQSQL